MKAYIFDLDGTLFDSLHIWEQIDADFLKKRGIEVPPDYKDAVSPLSFSEAAAYTIDRFNLPDSIEQLINEWNSMAEYAYGHTVPLKPYAAEYLAALKARGALLGVATTLSPALYGPALKKHGMEGLFDAVCSVNEVAHGKTKPDIYLLAAKKLGVNPCECVVFEDVLEAVRSAKQAGMTVIGVYDRASAAQWKRIQEAADDILYDFKDAPLPPRSF